MLDLSQMPGNHHTLAFAPTHSLCPGCKTRVPRHHTRTRYFWHITFSKPLILVVKVGIYVCPNCKPGCFQCLPPEFQTPSQYTRSTQDTILDMLFELKTPMEALVRIANKYFGLPKLNASTVQSWMRQRGEAVDREAHCKQALASFSGQMDIDELYENGYCLVTVTDPLNNIQLASEFLEKPATCEDIKRILLRLKKAGFQPDLVVTDGSKLYPKVLQALWPQAQHQRCVFHFIMDLNKALGKVFWLLYQRMPKAPRRKPGPVPKQGRPRQDKERKLRKERVRGIRYLIFTREDHLTAEEKWHLRVTMGLCPGLSDLRRLIMTIYGVFGTKVKAEAIARRDALVADPVLGSLLSAAGYLSKFQDDRLFMKLVASLDWENGERTSNHVERENRAYRQHQKARYRYRSLRSKKALANLLYVRKGAPSLPRRLRPVGAGPKGVAHVA